MDLWPLAIPAVVLMALWTALKGWRNEAGPRRLPVLASLGWLAGWFWEVQVVQPGDNIRVDAVLFYPLLLVLTVAALVSLFRTFRRRRIPPPPAPSPTTAS